jgi:hypothetical protein
MTLLTVTQDVCTSVGVARPTSVFSNLSGNRTMQEMLTLANEMAQRIAADTREWTLLKLINVFNGDGVTKAFNLPANYKRMLKTANVWRSTSAIHPMQFIPSADEWMQRRALNRFSPWGEWTILGGQMLIWPILGNTITASFGYLDKNCVALKAGGFGLSFVDDNDAFRLDERLLKLGMIWQWKAQKGSAYAEDMGTWADALGQAEGADQPSPILVGRMPVSSLSTAGIAYPFPAPTP